MDDVLPLHLHKLSKIKRKTIVFDKQLTDVGRIPESSLAYTVYGGYSNNNQNAINTATMQRQRNARKKKKTTINPSGPVLMKENCTSFILTALMTQRMLSKGFPCCPLSSQGEPSTTAYWSFHSTLFWHQDWIFFPRSHLQSTPGWKLQT